MLTRRQFVVASCCALHSPGTAFGADLSTSESWFICSTADDNPTKERLAPSQLSQITGESLEHIRWGVKSFSVTPFGTTFITDKWRVSDGLTPNTGNITLGFHFMDGSAAERSMFARAAQLWTKGVIGTRLAFVFDVPQDRSQIRVSFDPNDGNHSKVGRDNLTILSNAKTMNIQDVRADVVMHECGHVLGLRHEHQNPNLPFHWNRDAVIADMAALGWSEAMTVNNILSQYPKGAACVGDPKFNNKSIMLYPIPPRWTDNSFQTSRNLKIDKRDINCVRGIYGI